MHVVASSDAVWKGSLTAYRRKMTTHHFCHFIIKGQHIKQKLIEHSIYNETQSRKTKLVDLNTTHYQPRNLSLAE